MIPQTRMMSVLTLFLVATNLASAFSAFQQGGQAQDVVTTSTAQIPDISIDEDYVRNSVSVSASLDQALSIIKTVESLPSCMKVASSALMHSCSALEGSIEHDESELTRGSDLFIEEEADVYAARLAVCELGGAEYALPKDCLPFVPTKRATKKQQVRGWWTSSGPTRPTNLFQHYDDITQTNLKQCRKALVSDPRSWTSFSNSKQNAVSICRAMRSEVEKDEQLQVGKILGETAAAASESLQDAVNRVNNIRAQFHELATAMPQFQRDLAAENQQQLEWIQKFWMDAERLQSSLQDIVGGVTGLRDQVTHANEEVADLRTGISDAANESALQVKNAVASPLADINELSANVATVAELVEYTREQMMQDVMSFFYNITQDISVINAFMPKVQAHIESSMDMHTRMHEESVRSHEEMQQSVTQTRESLEQVHEQVRGFVTVVADVFEHGWAGAFPHLGSLISTGFYFVVGTLFSFAALGHLLGLSVLNNIPASLGCGIVIATASSLKMPTFTWSMGDLLPAHGEYSLASYAMVIGAACFGIAGTALWIRSRMRGRAAYDPASPPQTMKSMV